MASNSSATNKEPPGKVGRPTKFTSAMLKQARFLAEKGCTDVEMASFFGVSESTLNLWKIKHRDFSESLKEGKDYADSAVKRALYERATGYSHPDTHISNFQGVTTETPLIKHYPPDTTACIFWLKNRRPTEWRDKTEVTQTTRVEPVSADQMAAEMKQSPALRKEIEGMLEKASRPA